MLERVLELIRRLPKYAGERTERTDPHPWILDTKDHRIESRVLSHIFSRTFTGT